jgi:hypothetical protein
LCDGIGKEDQPVPEKSTREIHRFDGQDPINLDAEPLAALAEVMGSMLHDGT